MEMNNDTEVFRITPIVGKCYETTTYTRKIGNLYQEKYYSTNPLRYVGVYIKEIRYGYGDGESVNAIFNNNGKEEIVRYSYEGTTCFREVTCKEELNNKNNFLVIQ